MSTQTISTSAGPLTVETTEPTPGLHVYELPATVSPTSPWRWILAHHEGAALASFKTEPAAIRAAGTIAPLADWTRSQMTTANQISLAGNTGQLMDLLRAEGGDHPNA
jgi:hypothetical protein